MRQAGLTCRLKRHRLRVIDSRHSYTIYPHLLKGLQVEAPNCRWVADLTYVRLPEGFVYLVCLLDAYSCKCIGWNLPPPGSSTAEATRWRWRYASTTWALAWFR